MKRFYTILKTELKLSVRGMDMVIFALCMPLVIISLLGIIYGSKPAYPGAGYTFLEQSFGAVTTIAVCAGGVMGLPLVISEYRQKKILKRYQVCLLYTSPAHIPVQSNSHQLPAACTRYFHALSPIPHAYPDVYKRQITMLS